MVLVAEPAYSSAALTITAAMRMALGLMSLPATARFRGQAGGSTL